MKTLARVGLAFLMGVGSVAEGRMIALTASGRPALSPGFQPGTFAPSKGTSRAAVPTPAQIEQAFQRSA